MIVRYNWFGHETSQPVVKTYSRTLPSYSTDRQLAHWAKSELQLTGKIEWIGHPNEGHTHIEIATPRTFHMVKINHDDNSLTHETRPQNTHEMFSLIHRMHGIDLFASLWKGRAVKCPNDKGYVG